MIEMSDKVETFKKGDLVRKKNGDTFLNNKKFATVNHITDGYRVYMEETGTWMSPDSLEFAHSNGVASIIELLEDELLQVEKEKKKIEEEKEKIENAIEVLKGLSK